MKARILILAAANGLNQNLLRLALGTAEWEIRFAERPVASEGGEATHWVLDDKAYPDLRKFLKHFPPPSSLKGLIYLMKREKPGMRATQASVPIAFLVKPFDPRALRAMIGKEFHPHEP